MSEEHKSLLDNAFEANKGVLCKKLRIELIQKTGFSKKQVKKRAQPTCNSIFFRLNVISTTNGKK